MRDLKEAGTKIVT